MDVSSKHHPNRNKLDRLIDRKQYIRQRKLINDQRCLQQQQKIVLSMCGFSGIDGLGMLVVIVCVILLATFAAQVMANEDYSDEVYNETLPTVVEGVVKYTAPLTDNVTTSSNNNPITFGTIRNYDYVDIEGKTDETTVTPDSDRILQKWLDRGYERKFFSNVNPFWLTFEPPSRLTYHIFSVIYCVITVFGCTGNSFVIYMFMRFKTLRVPANMLVLNLAISDFIMLAKCPIAIYNNYYEGPALGYNGCVLYGFVGGLSGTATILTLTAIALDRYYVVVHPLRRRRNPNQLRHTCIPFIWLYSLVFAGLPALNIGLSSYTPEGYLTTCSFDYLDSGTEARIFMFVFFVAAWLIPLFIICHSYFYILKVVFEARRIQSNRDTNKTELKLAIIVFLIIGVWFIAWTPYTMVALSGIFGQKQYLSPTVSMIPALFCKLAACIDPYIYAVSHARFRQEFRRLVSRNRRNSGTTRSTVTRSSMLRRLRSSSIDPDLNERVNEFLPTLPVVCEAPEHETPELVRNISVVEIHGEIVEVHVDVEAPFDIEVVEELPKYMETNF